MKFEYELKYDFVEEELSFKILKMPERLRCNNYISCILVDGELWHIKSIGNPELSSYSNEIFLRGAAKSDDDVEVFDKTSAITAIRVSEVLKKFAFWVEENCNDDVEMTVAEIEEKLGIKNLKIIKEDK